MKIAFVTHASHPEMEDDDRPLAGALARHGALVLSAPWDDIDFDWAAVDRIVLRSPWGYYRRYREFLGWLARVETQTRVINPPDVVRWNASKQYLSELTARGIHVVPTAFVAREEAADLEQVCADRGWGTVVLKPAVSADSWETIRVEPARYGEGQAYLDRHRPERDILVQPFVKDIDEGGEQCLMFFGGGYSHAVKKNSAFLGGRHVGPEGRLIEPRSDAIAMARDVLVRAGLPELPYARVDLALDDEGAPMLLELELFEPSLFFREKPGSEEALAIILLS